MGGWPTRPRCPHLASEMWVRTLPSSLTGTLIHFVGFGYVTGP